MAALPDRLVDAVVDLVAEAGLAGVSVRAVASRAGVSVGAVQHHFPTKDAMVLAAIDRVGDLTTERIQAMVGRARTPAQALRQVARLLAAIEPGDRAATAVWVSFVSQAFGHEATAIRHRRDWARVEDLFAHLLAEHHGSTPARTADPAAHLLALVDGLAIAVAIEPERMTARRARALVDAAVRDALGELAPTPPAGR